MKAARLECAKHEDWMLLSDGKRRIRDGGIVDASEVSRAEELL